MYLWCFIREFILIHSCKYFLSLISISWSILQFSKSDHYKCIHNNHCQTLLPNKWVDMWLHKQGCNSSARQFIILIWNADKNATSKNFVPKILIKDPSFTSQLSPQLLQQILLHTAQYSLLSTTAISGTSHENRTVAQKIMFEGANSWKYAGLYFKYNY